MPCLNLQPIEPFVNVLTVVSIPDWGVTPFASGLDGEDIGKEMDQFNIINREETTRVGATYIDVTGISREEETKRDLLAVDGLHSSGVMYGRWVDRILPTALSISTGSDSIAANGTIRP